MKFSFHRVPVGIDNCYLLRGERTVLIDGGAPFGAGAFVRHMRQLGVDPQEIELVLLTHGHWDHIASLGFVLEQTGAKVAVHRSDQAWVEGGTPPFPPGVNSYGRGMIWMAERLIHPKLPSVKVDILLGDEGMSLAEYGIPGKVVHTPGHTQGSVMILLETGEAFVGDMAMNAWFLRRTPGLPVLAEDLDMVVESWKKVLPTGIQRVYPAHGMDFPADVIRKEILAYEAKR